MANGIDWSDVLRNNGYIYNAWNDAWETPGGGSISQNDLDKIKNPGQPTQATTQTTSSSILSGPYSTTLHYGGGVGLGPFSQTGISGIGQLSPPGIYGSAISPAPASPAPAIVYHRDKVKDVLIQLSKKDIDAVTAMDKIREMFDIALDEVSKQVCDGEFSLGEIAEAQRIMEELEADAART